MAYQHHNEDSSTRNVEGESSQSNGEIIVKTLNSQIDHFPVDKNMPVLLFKEKIANDVSVLVGQQRLLFRGQALNDDHLLSEYHSDNGHMLHLVVRQPAQLQDPSDTSAGETIRTTGLQGNDANAGDPCNWVGVGGQEDIDPDLLLGMGSQSAMNRGNLGAQVSTLPDTPSQAPQGNEADVRGGSIGSQSQEGGQAQSGQAFSSNLFQMSAQAGQIPLAAAAPLPNGIYSFSEFSLEETVSQNGTTTSPAVSSVGNMVGNGDATGSTNSMGSDSGNSNQVVPERNVTMTAEEILDALVRRTNRSQVYVIGALWNELLRNISVIDEIINLLDDQLYQRFGVNSRGDE